jgi:hypothetical protein
MNIREIIREELGDFDWTNQIDPYLSVKQYYEKYDDEHRVKKMLLDYAHLRHSKKNIYNLIYKFKTPPYLDVDLLRKALIKYYKENLPLVKRFLTRFFYDDFSYEAQTFIEDLYLKFDDLNESENDGLDWIRDISATRGYRIVELDMPNLYIEDSVVQSLDLPDVNIRGEKLLGYFSWVSDGIPFKFTANIHPIQFYRYGKMWKVVGTSGDSGFGYSWITKRNTLGKRARRQIFKQIIDRYKLDFNLDTTL